MSRRRVGVGRLRITGGQLRGRHVQVAPSTRPTQTQVREALCSRWGSRIAAGTALELFCGGGAVSIEFLSRGLSHAYLVDQAAASLQVARTNLKALELDSSAWLHQAELPLAIGQLPRQWPRKFSVIFADPPYGFDAAAAIVHGAVGLLEDSGELAYEHSVRDALGPELDQLLVDQRRYGETLLSFFGSP